MVSTKTTKTTKKKISFVSSMDYPGVSSVGLHGERAGLWDFNYLEVLTPSSIADMKSDILIFGAYHPDYGRLLQGSFGKVGYYVTSSSFEVEQTGSLELQQLQHILKLLGRDEINFVLFGDPSLAAVFSRDPLLDSLNAYGLKKIYHAPYPLNPNITPPDVDKIDGVSLMCPAKLSKNILSQLMAVKLLQSEIGGCHSPTMVLYTNLSSYHSRLNLLGVRCELSGWIPQHDYYLLLSRMKINLACSFAETLNYNVFESSMLNTTSIVSPAVEWYAKLFPDLVVANSNNPLQIKEKVREWLDFDFSEVRGIVLQYARKNNMRLEEILRNL